MVVSNVVSLNTSITNAVVALYVAVFDRSPVQNGLNYWIAKVDSEGWAIEMVADAFFGLEATQGKYPDAMSHEAFVAVIFNNILDRNPQASGLEYWAEQLDSGALSRGGLVVNILDVILNSEESSNEFLLLSNKIEVGQYFAEAGLSNLGHAGSSLIGVTKESSTVTSAKLLLDQMPQEMENFIAVDTVIAVYIAILNRAPLQGGLSFWSNKIDSEGWTTEMLVESFYNIPEIKQNYSDDLSNEAFLRIAFNNVVGREPLSEGLTYWTEQLDLGVVTRTGFIVAIINAGMDPLGNQNDFTLFSNKIEVARYFSATGSSSIQDSAFAIEGVTGVYSTVIAAQLTINSWSTDSMSFDFTVAEDTLLGALGNDIASAILDETNPTQDTLTFGDSFHGSSGRDVLKIDSNYRFLDLGSRVDVTSVESLMVRNTGENWSGIDIANFNFDDIILNEGGALSGGLSIENINTSAAILVMNIKGNDEEHSINFSPDDVSTEGNIMVTVSDVDLSSANESFSVGAIFTDASTVNTTINLTDISDLGNKNGGEYIHSLSTGAKVNVGTETVFNIENLVTADKFRVGLLIEQVDGAKNNAIIDLDNTDNVSVKVLLQNIDDNTPFTDSVTLNLDKVANSNSEAIFSSTNVEELNVNVVSNSEMDVIGSSFSSHLDVEEETASVNLDLNADLVVRQWDFNTNTESTEFNINGVAFTTPEASLDPLIDVAFNITGSGNITIAELNLGNIHPFSNTQINVNGSSATGDIKLATLSLDVKSVITGSGNDLVTAGSNQITVSTNGGNDYVDTHGYNFSLADDFMLDGGAGEDTIAINNGSYLVTGVMQRFEILDASGGRGAYDMEDISGLRDVIISGEIKQSIVLDNVAKQSVLTLNAFVKNGSSITINQEDNTGASGTLSVRLNAVDGNDSLNVSGETDAHIIVKDYESVRLTSNAIIGSEESTMQSSDYTNSVILDAPDMTNLLIFGNAHTELNLVNATKLTNIDATGSLSGIDFNFSSATSAISFIGSQGADTVTVSNHYGNFIQGSQGADTINLGTGADIIRYVSKQSSPLVLTETETSGFDIITGFTRGSDVIQLFSTLGLGSNESHFSMLQKDSIANENSENNMQNFIGDGIGFFSDTSFNRATAFAENGADGYLFIDVNNDGNFTTHADMVIQLSGVTELGILDIQFG